MFEIISNDNFAPTKEANAHCVSNFLSYEVILEVETKADQKQCFVSAGNLQVTETKFKVYLCQFKPVLWVIRALLNIGLSCIASSDELIKKGLTQSAYLAELFLKGLKPLSTR